MKAFESHYPFWNSNQCEHMSPLKFSCESSHYYCPQKGDSCRGQAPALLSFWKSQREKPAVNFTVTLYKTLLPLLLGTWRNKDSFPPFQDLEMFDVRCKSTGLQSWRNSSCSPSGQVTGCSLALSGCRLAPRTWMCTLLPPPLLPSSPSHRLPLHLRGISQN